jgi:NAD(P)-dependent dehydrogenase (short-subunit alcohol dehydrogenase family)
VGVSASKQRGSSLVYFIRATVWKATDSHKPSTVYGARVTAHYNTNALALDELIGEVGTDNIQKLQADLGVEGDASRMFGEINKGRFGPVQVIIVNHAIYVAEDIPLSQMSLAQWDRTINANLTSSFLAIREYLAGLGSLGGDRSDLKDKAAIVLVGSTAGKYGEAGHADYSATKSGRFSPLF